MLNLVRGRYSFSNTSKNCRFKAKSITNVTVFLGGSQKEKIGNLMKLRNSVSPRATLVNISLV